MKYYGDKDLLYVSRYDIAYLWPIRIPTRCLKAHIKRALKEELSPFPLNDNNLTAYGKKWRKNKKHITEGGTK